MKLHTEGANLLSTCNKVCDGYMRPCLAAKTSLRWTSVSGAGVLLSLGEFPLPCSSMEQLTETVTDFDLSLSSEEIRKVVNNLKARACLLISMLTDEHTL